MRRDLAVCRDRAGKLQAHNQDGAVAEHDEPSNFEPQDQDTVVDEHVNGATFEPTKSTADDDIIVPDAPPALSELPSVPTDNVADEGASAVSEDFSKSLAASPEGVEISAPMEIQAAAESLGDSTQSDPQAANPETMIDQKQEENPSANADLDSLFDETFSVGTREHDDHGLQQDMSNEFDFESFGANLDVSSADNDNISSLLPGLQDYANTQPSASDDVDLSALLSQVNDTRSGDDAQPPSMVQQDSTFDDLMDLPNFDGDDIQENNGNASTDLDFESFFS